MQDADDEYGRGNEGKDDQEILVKCKGKDVSEEEEVNLGLIQKGKQKHWKEEE